MSRYNDYDYYFSGGSAGSNGSANDGRGSENGSSSRPQSQAAGRDDDSSSNVRQFPRQEGQGASSQQDPTYENVHIYSKQNALCFSADKTKSDGAHTIRMEGASASGPRAYDWKNTKIAVQFTQKEQPFVLAVLLGFLGGIEFNAHGAANDKGFSLERQDGGRVYARIWQKGKGQRAVPILPPDIFMITDLLLRQMKRNAPYLTSDTIILMSRSVAAGYSASGGGGGNRN